MNQHCDCGGTDCETCHKRHCARCYENSKYIDLTGVNHQLDMDNASYHDFEWGALCLSGCGYVWFDYDGNQLEVTAA